MNDIGSYRTGKYGFTFEYNSRRFDFVASTHYTNFILGFQITPFYIGLDLLFLRFTLFLLPFPEYLYEGTDGTNE